ncbi:MAG TPA: hypothetical protein VJ883_08185 [Woeseiaceae bacterium]|nr:hypothetical protein [Woeseiaceae bacterium]
MRDTRIGTTAADRTTLGGGDIYLFRTGTQARLYHGVGECIGRSLEARRTRHTPSMEVPGRLRSIAPPRAMTVDAVILYEPAMNRGRLAPLPEAGRREA